MNGQTHKKGSSKSTLQQQNKLMTKTAILLVSKQNLLSFVREKGLNQDFQQFLAQQRITKCLKMSMVTSKTLAELCDKINQQSAYRQGDGLRTDPTSFNKWKLGEYKLFIWVSVFYAFHKGIAVEQMTSQDFLFIQTIFLQKALQIMQYELLCIYPSKSLQKAWNENHIKLLKTIVQRQLQAQKKLQWKSISILIFFQSKGNCFKTFSQCREMWLNHLNPKVNKSIWTKQQDYQLLTLAKKFNRSWAKISKQFNQLRTAHMIKNRYHSLIRRSMAYYRKDTIEQIEDKLIASLGHSLLKQRKSQGERSKIFKEDSDIIEEQQKEQQKSQQLQDFSLQIAFEFKRQSPSKQTSQQHHQYNVRSLMLDKNLLDINLLQIPKHFVSEDLLQKLGCVHIQQVQEAFQECYKQNQPFYL